ncbi:peptidoglycan recognition protein family protein [Terrisporobacter sp.]
MKKEFGFIRFDNIDEFEIWLNKEKVTRKINRLQVHHMDLPNYNTWKTTDKRIYGENRELGRTKSLDDYCKNKWNYPDGKNHYIAQHFNIFPNGKITTGRSLNSKPIGITGWNDNAICVEIYGDFDNKKDNMTDKQRKSVIAVYGLLCRKFKLTPNVNTIRPHCWFSASGTYLGDYFPNKSAKSCPGTNFMNFGNTSSAFINKFYPLIKEYLSKNKNRTLSSSKNIKMVKNISNEDLNLRSSPDWNGKIVDILKPGDSLTYVSGPLSAKGGSTKMYKCKNNIYITASSKYTNIITF